jgi:hypothetical protein
MLIHSPSLGAYFASRPLPLASSTQSSSYNLYALPAAISLVLLLAETAYLAYKLPETKGWKKVVEEGVPDGADSLGRKTPVAQVDKKVESRERRSERLKAVSKLHGLFLLFFSGVSIVKFEFEWDAEV